MIQQLETLWNYIIYLWLEFTSRFCSKRKEPGFRQDRQGYMNVSIQEPIQRKHINLIDEILMNGDMDKQSLLTLLHNYRDQCAKYGDVPPQCTGNYGPRADTSAKEFIKLVESQESLDIEDLLIKVITTPDPYGDSPLQRMLDTHGSNNVEGTLRFFKRVFETFPNFQFFRPTDSGRINPAGFAIVDYDTYHGNFDLLNYLDRAGQIGDVNQDCLVLAQTLMRFGETRNTMRIIRWLHAHNFNFALKSEGYYEPFRAVEKDVDALYYLAKLGYHRELVKQLRKRKHWEIPRQIAAEIFINRVAVFTLLCHRKSLIADSDVLRLVFQTLVDPSNIGYLI
jgi:hypothetical protein